MSYLNCRHGDPCGDCNGYIGPLDTYTCLCRCHDRPAQPVCRALTGCVNVLGRHNPHCPAQPAEEER